MSIEIDGAEKRIGLGLSGGGYRAAGFHLGVFYKLRELKLLDKIDVFSCVSGGSIAGSYYLKNRKNDEVLEGFETFLTTESIDIKSVLMGIINIFKSRTESLAKCYEKQLFKGATICLGDLKDGPRVYFNSTNIGSGNLFFFVTGENKTDIGMRDWKFKFHISPNYPVSKAVAASSAFPPVYPPLILSKSDYPTEGVVKYISLTDGGVYDNLGINPLLNKKFNNLDYVIVSDAGKPFELDTTPTKFSTWTLRKAIDITMEQVRGLSFYKLVDNYKANNGPKPLWFSIDSENGEKDPGDAEKAKSIGTRLEKLKKSEMEILKKHGGALVHARLKEYAPELLI